MGDSFNYVAVLVSIVTGLAATRILTALSDIIQVANRPRAYWIHTLWMITVFGELLLFWWVLYRWHAVVNWTFFLFVWVNLAPILIYLASGVMFPGDLEPTESPNWRDYYYKNRRGFFFIFGVIAPLDIIDTVFKGKQHFIDQGPLYLPFIGVWTFGCLIAGITGNEKYHAIWAIMFPLMLILYTAIELLNLG